MTRAEQDQHVAEFMRQHDFRWSQGGYWVSDTLGLIAPDQATFIWRTSVQAARNETDWFTVTHSTVTGDVYEVYPHEIEEHRAELDRLLETEGE
jgi:hypothetical protein